MKACVIVFVARRKAGIQPPAGAVARAGANFLQRFDLAGAEAIGAVGAAAGQRAQIEFALRRRVDHAVSEPVLRVAGFARGFFEHGDFLRRNRRRRQRPRVVGVRHHQPRAVDHRIADHRAVEVLRISLNLGQRHLAAVRAADEIRALFVARVERAHDLLGETGDEMSRAVAVVELRLRIVERPRRHQGIRAGVTGVGAGGGVTARQPLRQVRESSR